MPPDNKNSGQSIAALIAEKAKPVADVTYLGGISADTAKSAGVLTAYKPKGWEKIPAELKDPDGRFSSTPARSACSSTRPRSARRRCRKAGRICSAEYKAWSATSIRPRPLSNSLA